MSVTILLLLAAAFISCNLLLFLCFLYCIHTVCRNKTVISGFKLVILYILFESNGAVCQCSIRSGSAVTLYHTSIRNVV